MGMSSPRPASLSPYDLLPCPLMFPTSQVSVVDMSKTFMTAHPYGKIKKWHLSELERIERKPPTPTKNYAKVISIWEAISQLWVLCAPTCTLSPGKSVISRQLLKKKQRDFVQRHSLVLGSFYISKRQRMRKKNPHLSRHTYFLRNYKTLSTNFAKPWKPRTIHFLSVTKSNFKT